MVISVINRIDLRNTYNCTADGDYLPAFRLYTERYYDNCSIKSTYFSIFSQTRLTDDKVYNFIVEYIENDYLDNKIILFTNAIYNRIISCSDGTVTMKNVIDNLINNYPLNVGISDSCQIDLCEGIVCPNICIDYDLYSQKCVNGACVTDQLLEQNSVEYCNYIQPEESYIQPEEKSNVLFYGIAIGIIAIGLGLLRKIKKEK